MVHIAVCDDRKDEAGYITALVQNWAKKSGLEVQIRHFPSAEAFLFEYEENKNFDILLLDIKMGPMDGMALARQIRAENDTVQMIFVTGYPDYAAEGYEVAALHYLMKPVEAKKLASALDRALSQLGKAERTVLLSVDGEMLRVKVCEIVYVEAFAHKCAVTTVRGRFDVKMGISEMEGLLGEGFVRCHRSYLVNLRHIQRISKTGVALDNGTQVPLSRSQYQPVCQAFIAYYRRNEHETV